MSKPVFLQFRVQKEKALKVQCFQSFLAWQTAKSTRATKQNFSATEVRGLGTALPLGTTEVESVTSCMSSKRSNQLSYAPISNAIYYTLYFSDCQQF